ncbi:C40 family peptidase [Pseudomonas sp. MYb185]|uniref:C40 family peptidase n=1 Tax=Pseudomonas sp. MYb185 TaxID=1848729 RepID=UPI000CFCF035|nr:C40 family peptidase [Pseudomonas sp. MYb185]PRB81305.1 hydrolase Nlp/P60 [Pseudomonas sp. MYb185]
MRAIHLLLVLSLAVLAGCASAPQSPPAPAYAPMPETPSAAASSYNDDLLFHAFTLVGTPYRWGGNSPEVGFDCSGLINYVFRETAGLSLPRTTAGLSQLPGKAPAKALRPGDLLLFATSGKRVDHAGIYVGDGRFLHAPSTGGKVRIDDLQASYWQRSFNSARRVLDH